MIYFKVIFNASLHGSIMNVPLISAPVAFYIFLMNVYVNHILKYCTSHSLLFMCKFENLLNVWVNRKCSFLSKLFLFLFCLLRWWHILHSSAHEPANLGLFLYYFNVVHKTLYFLISVTCSYWKEPEHTCAPYPLKTVNKVSVRAPLPCIWKDHSNVSHPRLCMPFLSLRSPQPCSSHSMGIKSYQGWNVLKKLILSSTYFSNFLILPPP